MNFLKDVYKFFQYLTFVDIIFFAAIITLLILIVVLIYFIMINKDYQENKPDSSNIKKDDKKDLNELIAQIDKPTAEKEIDNEEEGELLDLESLTKKLQEERESNRINFTEYEKDQEEKAIISYDELLKKQNRYSINYEKEIKDDDVIIKKVNLSNLVNKEEEDKIKEVHVISYEKEEAFLMALKELNSLLN